jgi:hypothetical protein
MHPRRSAEARLDEGLVSLRRTVSVHLFSSPIRSAALIRVAKHTAVRRPAMTLLPSSHIDTIGGQDRW